MSEIFRAVRGQVIKEDEIFGDVKKEDGTNPRSARRSERVEIQSQPVTSSKDTHRSLRSSTSIDFSKNARSPPDTFPHEVSDRFPPENVTSDMLSSRNKKNRHLNSLSMIIDTAEDMLGYYDNKREMLERERSAAVTDRAKEIKRLNSLKQEVSFNDMMSFLKEQIGTPNPEQRDVMIKIKELDANIARIDKDLAEATATGNNVEIINEEAGIGMSCYTQETDDLIESMEEKIIHMEEKLVERDQVLSKMQKRIDESDSILKSLYEKEKRLKKKDKLIESLRDQNEILNAELLVRHHEEEQFNAFLDNQQEFLDNQQGYEIIYDNSNT